jgi:ABC-type amino acid transport substrate-binding protein/cytochrome c553
MRQSAPTAIPLAPHSNVGTFMGRDYRRWLFATALMVLPCGIGQCAAAGEPPPPLRLCADPTNLPFSSNKPESPGLYLEIGAALAEATGRNISTAWNLTYFGKRALRTTLLVGRCDVAIGLPGDPDFMGPRIIYTVPVVEIGYAVAVPPSVTVTSLKDLVGRRIAVQLGSTPQSLLAEQDAIETVTFREAEEAMQALAEGRVDAAFVWGPIAGYVNRTVLNGAFKVTPVKGPGLAWPAAIGLARDHAALRDELNRAIDAKRSLIAELADKYGFPSGPVVTIAGGADTPAEAAQANAAPASVPQTVAPVVTAAASAGHEAATATQAEPSAPPPEHPAGGDLASGREVFNGICAHCHGPDAIQAERRINLRLLKRRYGAEMDEKFRYTVTHGRPDKGMPNWKDVLTDEQFENILAFLRTVQAE